ncbi:hypothetical protein [Alteribacter aurantiacus]|uniref:hypothetical protein n=1 Tax=Alteribacter aurantiacus TaxID=254410 RepID=UPI0003F730B5|nr:hypothetical protein [Alteribacter aurantiacus]
MTIQIHELWSTVINLAPLFVIMVLLYFISERFVHEHSSKLVKRLRYIIVGALSILLAIFIESTYEYYFIYGNETIITGDQKVIMAKSSNHMVYTTDDDLIVAELNKIQENPKWKYTLSSRESITVHVSILIGEPDIHSARQMYTDWTKASDEQQYGRFLPYWYFIEDLDRLEGTLGKHLNKVKSSEVSKDLIEEILYSTPVGEPQYDQYISITLEDYTVH